jgi:phosphatidylglycerophosphatase A
VPHGVAIVGLTIAGVWAADRVVEASGEDDPSFVVIDEVAGTLLALGLAGSVGFGAQVFAVALFRVLDITKPGIIDRAQRLRPEGLGIMADDVLAGVAAGLATRFGAALLRR